MTISDESLRNPRIPRLRNSPSDDTETQTTGRDSPPVPPCRARFSMADFQDGRRFSAAENTTILQDTVTVFQNVTAKLGFLQPPQPPKKKSGSKTKKNQNSERAMNHVRLGVGLYKNFPLAHAALEGSEKREAALKESGHKQMNHVRGTDGWWRSMLVIEDRAIDNYLGPWILICANALLACLLTKVGNVRLPEETLLHLDTVSTLR